MPIIEDKIERSESNHTNRPVKEGEQKGLTNATVCLVPKSVPNVHGTFGGKETVIAVPF